MSVWVVCFEQSYDGSIFEGVFSTEKAAREYVSKVAPSKYEQELYSVEEYELQ